MFDESLKDQRATYTKIDKILEPYNRYEYSTISLEKLANDEISNKEILDYCHATLMGLWSSFVNPHYLPYVQAFEKWQNENINGIRETNFRLYEDELKYKGEIDLLVYLKKEKKLSLILLATHLHKKKSIPIQLMAWKNLCEKNGIKIEGIYCLFFKKVELDAKEGSFFIEPELISYSLDKKYLDVFKSCLNAYNYFLKEEEQHV